MNEMVMNSSSLSRAAAAALAVFFLLVVTACGSSIQGKYSNSTGGVRLELRSGGKATFTLDNESEQCSYSIKGKTLHLACREGKVDFGIRDNGSLAGPGFIGELKKTKS